MYSPCLPEAACIYIADAYLYINYQLDAHAKNTA